MCYLDEQTKCTVDEKLDILKDRFDALETQVSKLMQRLDSHDKVVQWSKSAGIFLIGTGVGAGLLSSQWISILFQI